ncbi:unnamed protein product [Phaedon cochleariae]|uniref:Major facilitator superfamily (MFS) profile domain-containing protein n=1 Tax=Phaedon cochleariae TaxID=80249 RepID=A0A9N9SEJ0_PHACE|nr:unnamed protein product [Phaedon cochleariae]
MINNEEVEIEEITYIPKPNANAELIKQIDSNNEEIQHGISPFLYFSAIVACMVSSVEMGFAVVWISPVAEKLLSNDTNENPVGAAISTIQLSSISAIPAFSSLFGSILLGRTCDSLGRRTAMIMLNVTIVIMKIFLAFATNIYMIFIPMIIMCFCLGGTQVAGRIYLTEIGEDHHKTKLVCFGTLGMPLGNVCSYLISSFIPSFELFTLACCIPLMLSVGCLVIFLPETPVYLISRKKEEEAFKALKKLRKKNSNEIRKEMSSISYILKETSKSENISFSAMFSMRAIRTAFFISIGVHLIAYSNGAPVIMSFLIPLFNEAGSSVPNYISINLLSISQLVFSSIATQTSERYGRRTLLLISTLGNAVLLFSIGVFYYLNDMGLSYIKYVSCWPIVGLILFYLSNVLGLASICWVIASEVFPTNVISVAMSLLLFIDNLVVATMVFMFPIIMNSFGMQWNFWIYSAICMLGYIFVYFKVPETKGKNLLEIQGLFERN